MPLDNATFTETVEALRQSFVPKWFCLAAGGLLICAAAIEIASVVRSLRGTRRPEQGDLQAGTVADWTLASRAAELVVGRRPLSAELANRTELRQAQGPGARDRQ